ncbi:MAG: hypothetical protein R3351_05490, partial [Nitrospirales bacterium]|nr:hypothetical protein [Nitrospirales bacterium]
IGLRPSSLIQNLHIYPDGDRSVPNNEKAQTVGDKAPSRLSHFCIRLRFQAAVAASTCLFISAATRKVEVLLKLTE